MKVNYYIKQSIISLNNLNMTVEWNITKQWPNRWKLSQGPSQLQILEKSDSGTLSNRDF